MLNDSFIWKECSIDSVEDIIRFEGQYQELIKNTPEEWSTDNGFFHHDFNEGSLSLLARGHFKKMSQSVITNPNDAFIRVGCSKCESLVIHSFIGFESCLYRKDSYPNGIPPFVDRMCQILDNALDKMPRCEQHILCRACVDEDKKDFKVGDIFEPGYVITTSTDTSWRNEDANRFVIKPLPADQTKARAIYIIYNKANEFQVSFLSTTKFQITSIENWGNDKKVFYMHEIE